MPVDTIDVYVYYRLVPLDALDNPLVLPLLGLLLERPGHPYELSARLAERYPHLPIRRSSVRTLTRSLEAAGLIKARRRQRVARRPARTVYELTDAGYGHVRVRVARDIVSARAGSRSLLLALSYIAVLPAVDAADALQRRLTSLSAELARASAAHSLPEYQMLEVSYWRELLQTEIAWMSSLRQRLIAGTIDWPTPAAVERER